MSKRRGEKDRSRRGRFSARLGVEVLEGRTLLSANGVPDLLNPSNEVEPNNTLDAAQQLGALTAAGRVDMLGRISGADVDWYHFSLSAPTRVQVAAFPWGEGAQLAGAISLYNSDPFSFFDPENATGHRLLSRAEGDGTSPACVKEELPAGDYFVAVSGAGNTVFHPFLADSGFVGATGQYALQLKASDLDVNLAAGPVVLATSPQAGAVLDAAPLVIRAVFSEELDAATILPGDTVRLLYSADGKFDSHTTEVSLAATDFRPDAKELQLYPAAPLAPGYYKVSLEGRCGPDDVSLTDSAGEALGCDADHPQGQDFSFRFRVKGIENNRQTGGAGDDSSDLAHSLGNLSTLGSVQIAGVIGDDPNYDSAAENFLLVNPAADVDFYSFQLRGDGRFAVTAEVMAGRIGSRLDAGVSLYRVGLNGTLFYVGGNDDTGNDLASTNGLVPLYTDATLLAGLTAGNYVLVVSSGANTPDIGQGRTPGADGVFDPNRTRSGEAGASVGGYVLNVSVQRDSTAPELVAATPAAGAEVNGVLTHLTLKFSEAMHLQHLARTAHDDAAPELPRPVFILGADGTQYFPRLDSVDAATNTVRFLLLDGLPNGNYELHLSGALGLTDLAGYTLESNDPSGDHVVPFTLTGVARGIDGDPQLWLSQQPNDTLAQPQTLGVLFPHELQQSVAIVRAAAGGSDEADYYRIEVLQDRPYAFQLRDAAPGTGLALFTATGDEVGVTGREAGDSFQAHLEAGVYLVRVSGWASGAEVGYTLSLNLAGTGDNPPPLFVGPRPASSTTLFVNPVRSRENGRTVTPFPAPADNGTRLATIGDMTPVPVVAPVQAVAVGPGEASVSQLIAASLYTSTTLPLGLGAVGDAAFSPAPSQGLTVSPTLLPLSLLTALSAGPVGETPEPAGEEQATPPENGRKVVANKVPRATPTESAVGVTPAGEESMATLPIDPRLRGLPKRPARAVPPVVLAEQGQEEPPAESTVTTQDNTTATAQGNQQQRWAAIVAVLLTTATAPLLLFRGRKPIGEPEVLSHV